MWLAKSSKAAFSFFLVNDHDPVDVRGMVWADASMKLSCGEIKMMAASNSMSTRRGNPWMHMMALLLIGDHGFVRSYSPRILMACLHVQHRLHAILQARRAHAHASIDESLKRL